MNVRHSTAPNEFRPTIIESRFLLSRLALEIEFLKHNPRYFAACTINELSEQLRTKASLIPATAIAILVLAIAIAVTIQVDRKRSASAAKDNEPQAVEVVMLDPNRWTETTAEAKPEARTGIGKDGKGQVGFQSDKGEGSGASPRLARGGGGGGEREPVTPQVGKLPPPSPILASIPKTPPVNPPSLPAAGIDIDPALWKDLKAPVYGDPRSTSNVPSKGPGEGGGIGTNNGLGIGEGNGPGVGPGSKGNIGEGERSLGCCGNGGAPDGSGRTFTGREVEQRARLISKPEPQYTEEARKNQVEGTVRLRVVFSSDGEVVQIRAVNTLPFGLTERAIAAARQIKFVPAVKGGHAVSVHMQLEYNFNLY